GGGCRRLDCRDESARPPPDPPSAAHPPHEGGGKVKEINFDGLIGPTHNYAGLSVGNIASQANYGEVAFPRAAAMQGLWKMKLLMDLGVPQGVLPPPRRPAADALRPLGFRGSDAEVLAAAAEADPILFRAACSASAMWRANAATVFAAPDTA